MNSQYREQKHDSLGQTDFMICLRTASTFCQLHGVVITSLFFTVSTLPTLVCWTADKFNPLLHASNESILNHYSIKSLFSLPLCKTGRVIEPSTKGDITNKHLEERSYNEQVKSGNLAFDSLEKGKA